MSRRRAVKGEVLTPCLPIGSLEPWDRCQHLRLCSCGASLHLGAAVEAVGFHSWQWMDEHQSQTVWRYPWGEGPEPDGWWERLAERDIAMYSILSARQGLGMLAEVHRHEPAGPCLTQTCQSRPAPECHDRPMMATVEGWRCREAGRVYVRPAPGCTCDGPPHRLICALVLG